MSNTPMPRPPRKPQKPTQRRRKFTNGSNVASLDGHRHGKVRGETDDHGDVLVEWDGGVFEAVNETALITRFTTTSAPT